MFIWTRGVKNVWDELLKTEVSETEKALDKSLAWVKLKHFLSTQLILRGKTLAPHRINCMDGRVHASRTERARDILRLEHLIPSEREENRSCWKAAFKSSRDSNGVCCHGYEGLHSSPGGSKPRHPCAAPAHPPDIYEGTNTLLLDQSFFTDQPCGPCAHPHPSTAVPSCPAPYRPVPAWWASLCGCGLRSWGLPPPISPSGNL